MLNWILSFFNISNFYPEIITWNKFISIKDDVIVLYIKDSVSEQGKEYLIGIKKKFSKIKTKQKIYYFVNSKVACQWFMQNKHLATKIVIIGIRHDCAYLYRLVKSKGIKVWLLKK